MPDRRFPAPWTARDIDTCFVVEDANGQSIAYVYYRADAATARIAKSLEREEARKIAVNIARLPDLMGKG